jgi:NADH:ubiquinone oxidoreductase subunit 6 (subunit J)
MTIAGVLFLAVIDSINPSAIAVTLWLLSVAREQAPVQVVTYVGAIFVTYLLLGVLIVAGIGVVLPSSGDVLRRPPGLIVQSLVGLALLVYGLTASSKPPSSQVVSRPSTRTSAALVLLGVGITAMELPTAVPYFAAIALIVEAELPIRVSVPLLGIYNLIFVLPPIVLLVGHVVFQKRLAEPYAALRQRLESGARGIMLWVAGLVGGWLFVTGTIELVARLR